LQAEGGTHQGGPGYLPMIAYNIQHNDGGEHRRKDRPNGGLYVNATDTALTVGTTDLTAIAYGGNNTSGALDVATACNAHGGSGRLDFESETFIAFNTKQSFPDSVSENVVGTLRTGGKPGKSGGTMGIAGASGIRRLTPVECERLQGFPDGWTAGQSDSARYRQLGNAVAVPCAEWLARRIVALT